ncbi:MAG: hypothetical protein H0U13_12485 [Gemmatimonadaceae bacterium]|nr:hypothetical protein [Gemmatimonadaceae bacterium]
MSVEKQVSREMHRVAFWRMATSFAVLPFNMISWLAEGVRRLALPFDALSDVMFMYEAEAARRYRLLTGVDIGFATTGDLNRYVGTNPKALAAAEKEEFPDDDDE